MQCIEIFACCQQRWRGHQDLLAFAENVCIALGIRKNTRIQFEARTKSVDQKLAQKKANWWVKPNIITQENSRNLWKQLIIRQTKQNIQVALKVDQKFSVNVAILGWHARNMPKSLQDGSSQRTGKKLKENSEGSVNHNSSYVLENIAVSGRLQKWMRFTRKTWQRIAQAG